MKVGFVYTGIASIANIGGVSSAPVVALLMVNLSVYLRYHGSSAP